ncbi:hypothetical protein PXD04_08960 [Methanosphaera sp. ISO3-F5]|uniref:hypothetical protein n=1 Tax=Methanosphaera sp. ISO3-F5 TaxID=1452353 RepID=UPI002B25F8B8|nr:hypothetical protein [Methanosphaera sp. ISO3-F5]WQH63817.1 hypothetical protein PXD04_08960 [Methanosphaera sp. ISO3-F5]
MKKIHKLLIITFVLLIIIISGLYINNKNHENQHKKDYNTTELTQKLSINMNNWKYDSENDIYYQLGLVYCTNPETSEHESLAIYVPGKYFNATDNKNGTYTCKVTDEKIGNFTAKNAPLLMPIHTGGYTERKSPDTYSGEEAANYTSNGMIYVYPGCRGKQNNITYNGGAPWGVTDLKAAIRYLRFNNDTLPGNTDNLFTFGHSGGGGQSALLGTTGDSELYYPYLESIGAAMVDKEGKSISDNVTGSMCWCPITSFDSADFSYEWNIGQYSDNGVREDNSWTSSLSDDLAIEYANYINNLNLKDSNGKELKLEKSSTGIYNNGTYYDYIKSVIEDSLNNFLKDTEFPYTSNSTGEIKTYNNAQEYVDSLNNKIYWVDYYAENNTVEVDNIEGFVKTFKKPTKRIGAFDNVNRNQSQNDLFGINNSDSLHFNKVFADLLENNSDKYSSYEDFNRTIIDDYKNDLSKVDALNNSIQTRVNMYNPMYFICEGYDGYQSSKVAKYWRIISGIEQGNTALTTEADLALVLNQTSGVESVVFETVWGQGHTTAERKGNSTGNLISWINECLT